MIEKNEAYNQDDEISLIDLFAVLWHRRVMILLISLIAMVGVVVFSVISLVLPTETSPLPNTYTPSALMLINNTASSGNAMAAALGATGLGGLAGLAGVSAGPTSSELAIYLVGANTLLDAVVDEFDLITKYKIEKSPRSASRKTLKKLLTAAYDEKSGVFTIGFTDTDPVFAQRVVNFSVLFLEKQFDEIMIDKNKLEKENLEINIANTYKEIQSLEQEFHELEYTVVSGGRFGSIPAITLEQNRITMELQTQRQVYTQLKVQYELLKVTMASERPTFQILEMAEVPDQKSGPSRGLICIIVTFAAGFFSVFLAFVLNAISNIRKDPEAMAKLRGEPKKD
ncbi:MAG: lipopolysaccharide biosynthesis protein [Treponema sp.]|jgi:uncharacterized protein involved in exopolysaccharide biosynthesis|nr:lipopolysaccharide biosynthesis protein [Treponema sp.]